MRIFLLTSFLRVNASHYAKSRAESPDLFDQSGRDCWRPDAATYASIVRVPEEGPEHWVAEHPHVGGPLYGALYGIVLGVAIGLLSNQSWHPLVATVPVGVVSGIWRANAMHRGLIQRGGTP
jgi:hypothetical protein